MFQLFKKRDFGEYISDTFQFFKQTGKHYFKSYFTISGGLLLVLVFVSYFLFQVYFDFFLNLNSTTNNVNLLKNFTQNNSASILFIGFLIFLFFILLSILNYSIPVIYLQLYEERKGNNFETSDILKVFKANFGRIVIFFLGLIFLITPLLILFFIVLVLLCFIIIGIPLILFAIPTAVSWVTLSFYEYINHKKGFFESFSQAFKYIFRQYFPIVGSLMTLYIIVQVSMSVFTFIPYMYGIGSIFTSRATGVNDESFGGMKILITVVLVFSMLSSYILNNLFLINQGLVYYSSRERVENISSTDSIDLIGSE